MTRILCCVSLVTTTVMCAADVSYTEEIVNSGIGSARIGASRTVRQVYVKGESQHVRDEIKTGDAVKAGSTILRLDRLRSYEIDHASKTFIERQLPPPAQDWWQASHPGMSSRPESTASKAAPKPVADDPNSEVTFNAKTLPDTMRIEGILCRRIAAQMRVRHYAPGSKKVRRETRYLYQAWVADDFPGRADIERFEAQREAKTTIPSKIGGGFGEIKGAVDDYDRLEEEVRELEGFPLQSQLKVFTRAGADVEEEELFRLSRKVSSFSHTPLSPSLFEVTKGLRRAE